MCLCAAFNRESLTCVSAPLLTGIHRLTITRCGSRDSLLVERRTRDRKVASSNPGRSGGRIFFSRVNFVCCLLFGVRSTPVLPQWHVKDTGRSAKSAGGRLHLNTRTPLTRRSRSGLTMPVSSGNLSGNELIRKSSGNS